MKIESLLRRKGGTKVTLDGVEYHFKPGPDGREFADVTNSDHIGIFASIREGYRVAGAETKAPEPVKPAAPAPQPSPAYIDGATEPHKDDLDKLDRPALAELFAKRFGRPPAPRLSPEKIIEALRDE
jgi:hypothetical protein